MADLKFKLLTPEAVELFTLYPDLARASARPWGAIQALINLVAQMENPDKDLSFDLNIMRGINKEHRHLHDVFVYGVFYPQTLRWPALVAMTKHYQKSHVSHVIGVSYLHKAVELFEADRTLDLLKLRLETNAQGLAEAKAKTQWDNLHHKKMVHWFVGEVKYMIRVLEAEEKAFNEQVVKAKALRDTFDAKLEAMRKKLVKTHAQLTNDIKALGIDDTLYNTNELLDLSPHSLGFTDWYLDDGEPDYYR